jgi:hypothetical protein
MIRICSLTYYQLYFLSPQFVTLVLMQNHNKSALDENSSKISAKSQSQVYWPVTFPKIKSTYKRVEPAVNEPIILRYNAKALFNTDCENLTFGKYQSVKFDSGAKSAAQLKRRNIQKLQAGELDGLDGEATQQVTEEQSRKINLMQQGRSRLFTKFPEIKTVFQRRKQPVNYLRRSMEYDF